MVVAFVVIGSFVGLLGASYAYMASGSILLALISFSVLGSAGALGVAFAVYARGERDEAQDNPVVMSPAE